MSSLRKEGTMYDLIEDLNAFRKRLEDALSYAGSPSHAQDYFNLAYETLFEVERLLAKAQPEKGYKQIVLARPEYHRSFDGRLCMKPSAVVWKRFALPEDLGKAIEFARKEGYYLLTFDLDVNDPLERAKEEVTRIERLRFREVSF